MSSSSVASSSSSVVPKMLRPAVKAYALGYLLDILPALLKLLIRFTTLHARRIAKLRQRQREERNAGYTDSSTRTSLLADGVRPALAELPRLATGIFRALIAALGPTSMATASALAMAATAVIERFILSAVAASSSNISSSPLLQKRRTRQIQLTATFVAASLSSGAALFLLQCAPERESGKASVAGGKVPALSLSKSDNDGAVAGSPRRTMLSTLNPFRSSSTKLELDAAARGTGLAARATPLAPGGHFLARLTALSVGGSPGAVGSATEGARSPVDELVDLPRTDAAAVEKAAPVVAIPPSKLGRPSPTIDLTLFALVRAMDTFLRATPSLASLFRKPSASTGSYSSSQMIGPSAGLKSGVAAASLVASARARRGAWGKMGSFVVDQAEGLTFVVACAVIMWNWFYAPERLPPTYVKWITNLADMDERVQQVLRCRRNADPYYWQYQDKSVSPAGINLVASFAETLGYPYEWGDPTQLPNTAAEARQLLLKARAEAEAARKEGREVKVSRDSRGEPGFILDGASGPRGRGEMGGLPCELVHCGVGGASCFANAALRWWGGFKVSMGIYVPVHLLPRLLFAPKAFLKAPLPALWKVLQGSVRSASFLSTFIASIWFMVCIGRSLLLPKLFPNVPFSFWDAGLGPAMGSLTCGWSVFLEEKRKRAEMALYVAPRALFACAEMAKPGWASGGERGALWTERVLFGLSLGVVTTAARYRPDLLRGITSTMAWVVKNEGEKAAKRVVLKPASA